MNVCNAIEKHPAAAAAAAAAAVFYSRWQDHCLLQRLLRELQPSYVIKRHCLRLL
jgi:hypothetical protein